MQLGAFIQVHSDSSPRRGHQICLRKVWRSPSQSFLVRRSRRCRCRADGHSNDAEKASGQSGPVSIGRDADNAETPSLGKMKKSREPNMEDDESEDEEESKNGLEELGSPFVGELSAAQEQYKAKLAAKLQKDQEEERLSRAARSGIFDMAKAAYTRGRYANSVTLFEEASKAEGTMSALGGDILMWLALAYQATGDDARCIATYQSVEDHHPLRKVRNQAANLRFICQAPKMKRGPDEKVAIPVLKVEDRKKQGQRSPYRRPVPTAAIVKRELTLEERFWAEYKTPTWTRNRYVWWAAGILGLSLAAYSVLVVDKT